MGPPTVSNMTTTNTFGTELLDLVRQSARQRTKLRGVDEIDEVAAETAYQYLKTRANTGVNGRVVNQSTLAGMRPYVSTIARNVVARQSGMVQSADRWALSEYIRRRAVVEQAQGRTLNTSEEDELAEEIRGEQRSKHRATAGFHRRNHIPSTLSRARLYQWIEMTQPVGMEGRPADAPSAVDFEPDSIGDELLIQLDRGEIGRSEARLYVWDAFAQRHNAPRVARGVLKGDSARRIAERITHVGVVDVASRWREQAASGREERDLFAPFGPLHQIHKERVTDVILGVPDRFADRVFKAAAAAAACPVAA